MASGRPLLTAAEPDSEVARAVASAGCGVCITPGDSDRLAESIQTLYEDAALRDQMGQQGRRYAEAHHSKHAAVTRYDELLRRVAHG
jgi:colanic acid biosynthesis glycosyl transferase WcaI